MIQKNEIPEWQGKKIIILFTIFLVGFFGLSVFTLVDGMSVSSDTVVSLCDTGFCQSLSIDDPSVESFVQYGAELKSSNTIIQTSDSFNNLKLQKNTFQDYVLNSNSAILFPSKDTFLREGIKNNNEGGNEVLRVMGNGQTNNRVLITFDQNDLEEILTDKTLTSAKLRLFIISNDGQWIDRQGLNLHMVNTAWGEGLSKNAPFGNFIGTQSGATWNCSFSSECTDWDGGLFVSTNTDNVAIPNNLNEQWIEFDVTNDIQSFLDNTENNGWIIMKANENSPGRVNFASKESSINVPQLEITFT